MILREHRFGVGDWVVDPKTGTAWLVVDIQPLSDGFIGARPFWRSSGRAAVIEGVGRMSAFRRATPLEIPR